MPTETNPSEIIADELLESGTLDSEPNNHISVGLSPRMPPNEVVGYRIIPDEYNWKVCIVRKYGLTSKTPGAEYATPLAYCKTLAYATEWIVNRDSRMLGEMHDLKTAFQIASDRAIAAVQDLSNKIAVDNSGKPLARLI
jgi:hypothetical protein